MPYVRFLVDYRGVQTDELYYEAGQVVDLDKVHQPFNVPELLREERLELYDPNAVDELEEDVEVDIPVELEPEEAFELVVELNATPTAVELAEENDLSLALIEGSGDDGKVLVGDVRAALELLAEDDGSPVELDPEPEVLVGENNGGVIMNTTEDGGW